MRSWHIGFSGPSITVRAYSITGFTLVRMGRVSVFGAVCLALVLQKPPVLPRVGMIRDQSPRPAQRPGGQTRLNQSTGGQTNPPPPNRCKTPPIAPNKRGKPTPANPGANPARSTGANQPRQTNRGQPPHKQSPNCWGPINPQTGQTINPGQPPAKPKQLRKRGFEVCAN